MAMLLAIPALLKADLHFISFSDIYDPVLAQDAIIRQERGFENDFLALHCAIRKYAPFNMFEIGTCHGTGTIIIKNAIGDGTVYSLELHPDSQGDYHLTMEEIGYRCSLPYIQLFGDSMTYDYTQNFPIDSWFIDGQHDYIHVYYETLQAIRSNPKLIVWHDTDIQEVFQGVLDAFSSSPQYDIYRIIDTRVSFAVKRNL